MTEYGVLGGSGLGTGIALPGTHPAPYPGYTPLLPARLDHAAVPHRARHKVVVGLRSVAQLTLRPVFSVLRVMTEVYNLREIHNR